MAEDYRNTQRDESKDQYVWQHINESYEMIRDDKADPPIQPEIQLKEGWRNGNIKIGIGPPVRHDIVDDPRLYNEEHHWDVYLQVASLDSDIWEAVTAIYVRTPPS